MTVSSMTGYARIEGSGAGFEWIWEARSVNSRGFDVRLKLPPGWSRLEAEARARVSKRFARGRLELSLSLWSGSSASGYRIDHELLTRIVAQMEEICGVQPGASDLATLLTIQGVVMPTPSEGREETAETQERDRNILVDLDLLIDALAEARMTEGRRLEEIVLRHLGDIERLTGDARAEVAATPIRIEERLTAQLRKLSEEIGDVPPERIAQELALILVRGDVQEEIDRIGAHIEATRELLAADDTIGRRLEFLCQEFNREANTLCAKSMTLGLTRTGLELKAAIDRLREQSQNIA